jgi:hypothetical protein
MGGCRFPEWGELALMAWAFRKPGFAGGGFSHGVVVVGQGAVEEHPLAGGAARSGEFVPDRVGRPSVRDAGPGGRGEADVDVPGPLDRSVAVAGGGGVSREGSAARNQPALRGLAGDGREDRGGQFRVGGGGSLRDGRQAAVVGGPWTAEAHVGAGIVAGDPWGSGTGLSWPGTALGPARTRSRNRGGEVEGGAARGTTGGTLRWILRKVRWDRSARRW